MKLKNGFVLREVAGECVVVPAEEDLNFNGMITLNATGKLLWSCLEKGTTIEEMAAALCNEYDIDQATASADATEFADKLKERGFLE